VPKSIPEDDPHAAYEERLGGQVWVYSESDGSKIGEHALPSPVVWDGMAAASGHLYLATADGRVICLGPND
jgi:hypothetical protein